MKVSDVLKHKGKDVYTIGDECSISEAIDWLQRYRVGALVVLDDRDNIKGIISERDILKHLSLTGGELKKSTVRDVMTPGEKLIVGTENDDLDYVMSMMTTNRIRHLPIIGEGKLRGILSIGDVVNTRLSSKEHENKMLQDYITGQYPA